MSVVRIRLWDLPLRVFHWSLAAVVPAAIATGLAGGAWMVWHGRLGLAVSGLLAFRFAWGFVGSTYARFSAFWPTPGKVGAYWRGEWHGIGHNPLGALSVFALLGLLAFQAGSGLFANDDISFIGPLHPLIGKAASDSLSGWHRRAAWALYPLLALHVAAIAFYAWIKGRNLIGPMITGWHPGHGAAQPQGGSRLAFWAALILALLLVYGAGAAWLPPPDPLPIGQSQDW